MVRSILWVAGLHLCDADSLDEASMLQMPAVVEQLHVATEDCACPGYIEADCRANEFQGCMWSDAGDSNAPWCQCNPDFEPTVPLHTDGHPICCEALTASCQACKLDVSVDYYCTVNPSYAGCEVSASMLQKIDATEDCACPAFFEADCRSNAYQGCIWTDAGDSNAPWCQCDPDFVPPVPLYTDGHPICCEAMTASCQACKLDVSVDYYCTVNPTVDGCDAEPEPTVCCEAITASCQACSAGQTILEYCENNPSTDGCVHTAWVGCFVDDGNRDLQEGPMQYGFTMETCAAECWNYNHFALQNNGWCVCGNAYGTEPQYAQVADSGCGGPCAGESSGSCGAGWRNAVYNVIRPVNSFPNGLPDFALYDAALPLNTADGVNVYAADQRWSINWGGSDYTGRLSPFQGVTLPGLDAAYGLTGDQVVTQVAWAYPDPHGTQDILDAVGAAYPETTGHRFIRTGGYIYVNAAFEPVALKEIAPAPRPVPADMATPDLVLQWASSPITLTAEQAANACESHYHPITLGAFYAGGARHYCWQFSDATADICPHGCFMYDMEGSSAIAFPIVW